MSQTIRVEESETDEDMREWKEEIEKTRNKIKKLERPRQEPSHPQPDLPRNPPRKQAQSGCIWRIDTVAVKRSELANAQW